MKYVKIVIITPIKYKPEPIVIPIVPAIHNETAIAILSFEPFLLITGIIAITATARITEAANKLLSRPVSILLYPLKSELVAIITHVLIAIITNIFLSAGLKPGFLIIPINNPHKATIIIFKINSIELKIVFKYSNVNYPLIVHTIHIHFIDLDNKYF